jgi:hypothetical protein
VERIKEESRRRRQAILEKYNQQQKEQQEAEQQQPEVDVEKVPTASAGNLHEWTRVSNVSGF